MNIVIDMQGWQASSRHRGIGRYTISLVTNIIELNKKHHFTLLFNGFFKDSIYEFNKSYPTLNAQVHIWHPLSQINFLNPDNTHKRIISEKIYKSVVASLNPDFLLFSSVYEGLIDDAICYIDGTEEFLTGSILYDLIPLIYPDIYQSNEALRTWYKNKTEILNKSDYLFSISESARNEAVEHLSWDPQFVVNISTAADARFTKINISENTKESVLKKYSIKENFLMYTGGWDHRKNIFRLIESYSLLSRELRKRHQLVIVCSITNDAKNELFTKAKAMGIDDGDIALTGYVSDDELLQIYNLCHAFVFPSWHEGFGLPVLEAMSCGRPVVTSNLSSLPEVLDFEDALFDPYDVADIANKIEKVLINDDFRVRLQNHYINQILKFSWELTASTLLATFDIISEGNYKKTSDVNEYCYKKKSLAYFSPIPPEKSGISFYSEELLPYLSKYYLIDIVSDCEDVLNKNEICGCKTVSINEFKNNYLRYDRVLYQIGNSHFHEHMFELIKSHPGIAVLHDFFLSGAVSWKTMREMNGETFNDKLYESHGYNAVIYNNSEVNYKGAILRFPCNYPVLENASALIFHSKYSMQLCNEWYSTNYDGKLNYIPLLRTQPVINNKSSARKKLNLNEDDIIIISLGFIAPTKLNHRIITAFNNLDKDATNVKLVFVGHNPEGEYNNEITALISASPLREAITITGWVSDETYKDWLQAADIGIQLRAMSRGETSAAVLDCMNYGLATIANANGSMAELDRKAVFLIDDDFSDCQLIEALNNLVSETNLRQGYASKASQIVSTIHSPEVCAEKYYKVIESSYLNSNSKYNVLNDIKFIKTINDTQLDSFAQSYADSFKVCTRHKVYLDITSVTNYVDDRELIDFISSLVNELPSNLHCEPIINDLHYGRYLYAQTFMNDVFKLNGMSLSNKQVDNFRDSSLIIFNPTIKYIDSIKYKISELLIENDVKFIFTENSYTDFVFNLNYKDDAIKEGCITLLKNSNISMITLLADNQSGKKHDDISGLSDVGKYVEFMTINELIVLLCGL